MAPVINPVAKEETRSPRRGTASGIANKPQQRIDDQRGTQACRCKPRIEGDQADRRPQRSGDTPSCKGHRRRSKPARAAPSHICQAFVSNEGRISMTAACAGGITPASKPMESVGKPQPKHALDQAGEQEYRRRCP
jgi:hypothetical protein